jgi:hypothetical protein
VRSVRVARFRQPIPVHEWLWRKHVVPATLDRRIPAQATHPRARGHSAEGCATINDRPWSILMRVSKPRDGVHARDRDGWAVPLAMGSARGRSGFTHRRSSRDRWRSGVALSLQGGARGRTSSRSTTLTPEQVRAAVRMELGSRTGNPASRTSLSGRGGPRTSVFSVTFVPRDVDEKPLAPAEVPRCTRR